MTQEKDINYWKNNCEEDYMTTPISVLRYISELEKLVALPQQEICISCDEQKETHKICMDCIGKMIKENQQEISDGGKDTADYIDRHLVAALVQHSIAIEISDEEIEKGATEWYKKEGSYEPSAIALKTWGYAIRWYREQLKTKKD
jgi:ribosomal protein L32